MLDCVGLIAGAGHLESEPSKSASLAPGSAWYSRMAEAVKATGASIGANKI